MSQIAVEDRMSVGVLGQVATLQSMADADVATGTNEEEEDLAIFGTMVAQGSADDGTLNLAATSDVLAGIVTHAHGFSEPQELDTVTIDDVEYDGLKFGATYGLGKKGSFRVLVEESVTPSSEVHVRAVASGTEVPGAFRATGDGTNTIDISAFAKFRTSGDADNPPILDIDMTNAALAVADS